MEAIKNHNTALPREEKSPLAGSPARATSEKALIRSDTHTLHRDDAELVDRRADSFTVSGTTESHAQTKELRVLTASSEQRSEAAKHIQLLMDIEETRDSSTKTS